MRVILITLLIGLIAYDTVTTIRRNRDWSVDSRLYAHDLQFEPHSYLLHNNLGVVDYRQGRLGDAKREFLQAIEASRERYDVAYDNLGLVYQREGRDDLAESSFRTSITVGAGYEPAYCSLSKLYLRQERILDAGTVTEEGLKRYPQNTELHYNLGFVYMQQERYAEAKNEFMTVQHLTPGFRNVADMLQRLSSIPATP
jgi:tetratricopeptide (TPR) repeat protein